MSIGRPMPDAVRSAFEAELAAVAEADTPEARWRALERAHILSQPWPGPTWLVTGTCSASPGVNATDAKRSAKSCASSSPLPAR